MSIALVPTFNPNPDVPEPLRLVVLAERWARACADREHQIGQGAAMVAMRVVESRIAVHGRALHAALAAAVPGYDPGNLQGAVDAEAARYDPAAGDHLFRPGDDRRDHHEGDPR